MKKIKIYIILILLILLLTGCKNKADEEMEKLKGKNKEELRYLSILIVDIANKLNNLSFDNYEVVTSKTTEDAKATSGGEEQSNSEENNPISLTEMIPINIINNKDTNVDWDKVSYEVEKIYETWTTTILDCYKLNVKNEDILEFSNKLDHLTMNVKAKDKQNTLISLTQVYSMIPKFVNSYDGESINTSIYYTKSNVLNSYSSLEQNKWDVLTQDLINAENYFSNILNDAEYSNKHKINIDKTYVLLKELQNSAKLQDREVFLIKYKLLIKELKTLN